QGNRKKKPRPASRAAKPRPAARIERLRESEDDRPGRDSSAELVEKEIKGGNPAVPGNDEISPGVRWRLTRAARYPSDPPAIAQFLGRGNCLISKVRGSSPDRARDPIDLVTAGVDSLAGV